MSIPIGSCFGHSITDLLPGLEALAFERNGSQRLAPGLNQIQVGGICWLENEFPVWMSQAEQQPAGCSMHRQNIQDCRDALHLGGKPLLEMIKKIDPIDVRSPILGNYQGFSCSWLKGSKDVTLGSLSGLVPLRSRQPMHHLFAQKAFGRLWSNLIQIHDTSGWWLRVKHGDKPLFFAKSRSTQPPNQCLCLRHLSPSACKISLIQLCLMATPLCSFRYSSSRSSAQWSKDKVRSLGLISAVATTRETSLALYLGEHPVRVSLQIPDNPASLKRLIQLRTVFSAVHKRAAIWGTLCPWLAGAVRERLNRSIVFYPSAVMARTCKIFGIEHLTSEVFLFYHYLVDAPLSWRDIKLEIHDQYRTRNVVISGLTAAGKTTHARILQAEYGFAYVSASTILREKAGIHGQVPNDFWLSSRGQQLVADMDKYGVDDTIQQFVETRDEQVFDCRTLPWLAPKPVFSIWLESSLESRVMKSVVFPRSQ